MRLNQKKIKTKLFLYSFVSAIILCLLFYIGYLHYEKQNISISYNRTNITDLASDTVGWIENINENRGLFFARKPISKKSEIYYFYPKDLKIKQLIVGTDNKSLILSMQYEENHINNTIFQFETKNKKAQYVILNGEKIDVKSIPILSE